MKTLLFLLLIAATSTLHGQRLELMAAMNYNSFYGHGAGIDRASYHSAPGFSAGIALDSIKWGRLKPRYSMQFDFYQGSLKVTEGGPSYSKAVEAQVQKLVVGLCFMPFYIRTKKRIDFNFGLEVSGLIHENFSGTTWGYGPFTPTYSYNLTEHYKRFSSILNLGLKARIGYNIQISNSWDICIQYLFYRGLGPEFYYVSGVRSMRHCVGVGFRKKIRKR